MNRRPKLKKLIHSPQSTRDHDPSSAEPISQSVEFFTLCADDFYERFFIVSGSTPVEQTNPSMVWRQPSSLDDGHAVFSKSFVIGLPVCPCFGGLALPENPGAYSCGLVGAGGFVGFQSAARGGAST